MSKSLVFLFCFVCWAQVTWGVAGSEEGRFVGVLSDLCGVALPSLDVWVCFVEVFDDDFLECVDYGLVA